MWFLARRGPDVWAAVLTLFRGFTKEFVEEIEAQLIRDRELSKHLISNHFTYLNPQKEEG